jgi:hypothetical protein
VKAFLLVVRGAWTAGFWLGYLFGRFIERTRAT